jgi:endonuclease/exonuclease/phosphatase family metal-dependent hydrolase
LRKFLKYSFLIGCIVNALLLSICRVIPNINPFEQSIIGILSFLTPVFAVINFAFILFWIFTKKFWFVSIPLVAFFLSWGVVSVTVGGHFWPSNELKQNDSSFTLMSYNVRLLDLYNWSGDKSTRKKMLDFIKEKKSSVLCLQEFYSGNDSVGIDNIKAISDSCNYPYYAECAINENKRGKWGSIIFSKLPIVKSINHDIDVAGSNLLQEVQLKFKNDTFSIFNVHLKSNKFSSQETDLVANGSSNSWDEKTKQETKSIYSKLEKSSINRGLESSLVSRIIKKNKYPSIVCGDLNEIASSYVYFKIRGNKKDAFLEKGLGFGATYNKFIPLLRIDYLFHDEKINLLGFEKLIVPYSDHYPLFANFSM